MWTRVDSIDKLCTVTDTVIFNKCLMNELRPIIFVFIHAFSS